jgi:hypothetical protein
VKPPPESTWVIGPTWRQEALQRKLNGESSMSEKAGRGRTVEPRARRDPDGKVKAKLPEPKCPSTKLGERERRMKPAVACSSPDVAGGNEDGSLGVWVSRDAPSHEAAYSGQ